MSAINALSLCRAEFLRDVLGQMIVAENRCGVSHRDVLIGADDLPEGFFVACLCKKNECGGLPASS
jgi:hypothetical protein